MKKRYLVFLMFLLPSIAIGYPDRRKENYEFSKCAYIGVFMEHDDRGFQADLTYNETCKYGYSGCARHKPDNGTKNYWRYCISTELSQCFEKKMWKTKNEIVSLDESIQIGIFMSEVSNGKTRMIEQYCAYYN